MPNDDQPEDSAAPEYTPSDRVFNNLADALAAYNIELEPAQIDLLDRYCAALWRWNEQLNLTRHTTLDGIIIAIARPDLRITLAESTQKKARVLQSIVDELGLPVEVFAVRAEELLELRTFDTLVARAVAPLWKLLSWLAPHWQAFDELLAIKGKSWIDERAEARHRGLLKKLDLRKAAAYAMPGNPPGESVILRLHPRGASENDEDA
jgi:16S rRNA (guanine527-N7)-methyltransferase